MDSQTEHQVKNNVKRVSYSADAPQTLAEIFLKGAAKFNRADALNYKTGGGWKKISSDEMIARAENIALGLYSLGVRRGDRIALLAANSPEWTLVDAGCQFAGVVDVPIYTTLAANAACYIINDAGVRVFFLQDIETYERLKEISRGCKTLEKLVFFAAEKDLPENAVTLEELEKAGAQLNAENPELIKNLLQAVEPDDVATLIYTSGTTGEPKGVMLSHSNIIANVDCCGANFSFSEKDVPISVLPLSHIFERSGMYAYIYGGMAVHYAESIDKAADNLLEIRPTIFVGVPRIFEKAYARAKAKAANKSRIKEKIFDWAIEIGKTYALKVEQRQPIPRLLAAKHSIADYIVFSKFRKFFGGRLRFCITGGAAISDEITLIFNGAGVRIMQGYGLTETSPVVSTNTPMASRLGSVGKPIENVSVRIAEDGEIEVSGANVMLGYYNKEDATREVFTGDGWFRTGDIGRIDADGFLFITDRKKELFKTSGGKYIAPSVIEQMIKGSRFVNQVVLVGDERKFPAALIVPNFEQLASYAKHKNLDIKTPAEFCSHPKIINLFERQVGEFTASLSQFERVKKIALLENEFTVEGGELTPTLKIKRRVIDEKYRDIIEKIYS
ncbi:MAG: long-chain fatty acid--CoA ligase [Acidobacteriota bacterium]|nr:long-chain fatty acid--CoA ligase [Acidobacteriota bacterium]